MLRRERECAVRPGSAEFSEHAGRRAAWMFVLATAVHTRSRSVRTSVHGLDRVQINLLNRQRLWKKVGGVDRSRDHARDEAATVRRLIEFITSTVCRRARFKIQWQSGLGHLATWLPSDFGRISPGTAPPAALPPSLSVHGIGGSSTQLEKTHGRRRASPAVTHPQGARTSRVCAHRRARPQLGDEQEPTGGHGAGSHSNRGHHRAHDDLRKSPRAHPGGAAGR